MFSFLFMGFEQQLENKFFSDTQDRTFIDKVLARKDIDDIRNIIRKVKLTREDLLELLYLLSGSEAKLLNYSAWDRYVILKFFVWIREFIKVAELLYDYQDDLKLKAGLCQICSLEIPKKCKCDKPKPKITLTERTIKLLYNNERLIEHNAKFLIDLYFNIGRSSLSIGATGLMEILKNKYELSYPQGFPVMQPQPIMQNRK